MQRAPEAVRGLCTARHEQLRSPFEGLVLHVHPL